MNRRLSRRTFIASAAASMIPSAIAHSHPRNGGLFSLFNDDPKAEGLAEPKMKSGLNMSGYTVNLEAATSARFDASLLNGVMILEHPGSISEPTRSLELYYSAGSNIKEEKLPALLKMIPYYAWANREPAAMQVWIPYTQV